jgi:hypothetical protein
MEEARVRVSTGPASPARDEAVRQVTADLAVIGRTRGEDLDEVRQRCDTADSIRRGGQIAGTTIGVGVGAALALNGGDPLTIGILGVCGATIGGIVLYHLGRDGAQFVADKFVQATGAREVVDRWTAAQDPIQPPKGKQNAVTDLLHEVRTQLDTLPDGPDKSAALAFIDKDLKVAGQAQGTTLPELQQATQRRERLVKIGSWTGIGVGVVLTGALVLRATQGLVDPLTAIRGTITGGGIAMVGSWQGGKWVGGKLGDRHQVKGMDEVLERWQPIFDERERIATEARTQATALVQGGEKASIRLEEGGLRVGGVLLRVPQKR